MPVRYLGMNRIGDHGFVLTSKDEVRSKGAELESSDYEWLELCYITYYQYMLTTYALEASTKK